MCGSTTKENACGLPQPEAGLQLLGKKEWQGRQTAHPWEASGLIEIRETFIQQTVPWAESDTHQKGDREDNRSLGKWEVLEAGRNPVDWSMWSELKLEGGSSGQATEQPFQREENDYKRKKTNQGRCLRNDRDTTHVSAPPISLSVCQQCIPQWRNKGDYKRQSYCKVQRGWRLHGGFHHNGNGETAFEVTTLVWFCIAEEFHIETHCVPSSLPTGPILHGLEGEPATATREKALLAAWERPTAWGGSGKNRSTWIEERESGSIKTSQAWR